DEPAGGLILPGEPVEDVVAVGDGAGTGVGVAGRHRPGQVPLRVVAEQGVPVERVLDVDDAAQLVVGEPGVAPRVRTGDHVSGVVVGVGGGQLGVAVRADDRLQGVVIEIPVGGGVRVGVSRAGDPLVGVIREAGARANLVGHRGEVAGRVVPVGEGVVGRVGARDVATRVRDGGQEPAVVGRAGGV